jgi:hypothetical protein
MTDTTDIAALRSKAANVIGLLTAESLTGSFALDSLADVFDDMFRLLEAERQRADVAVTERNTAVKQASAARNGFDEQYQLREKAEASVGVLEGVIARKEFDALKGDQVPVGYIHDHQLASLMEGNATTVKPNSAFGETVELFTAQQKPVLHPQLLSDIRQCAIDATAWCTHRTPPDYVSNVNAWLADGGTVKDAE